MSYIQIEIGGKLRGLKFNQGALIIFQSKIDKEDIAATTPYALIWAGLKANAFVKEIELVDYEEIEKDGKKVEKAIPLTFEKVCDWVDDLSEETVSSVINCFKETQVYKRLIPDKQEEQDDKKKLIMEPSASELVVDT